MNLTLEEMSHIFSNMLIKQEKDEPFTMFARLLTWQRDYEFAKLELWEEWSEFGVYEPTPGGIPLDDLPQQLVNKLCQDLINGVEPE